MGLSSLDNTPRPVPLSDDAAAGGTLHAMMLDIKRTFDEIVEAHADPDRAGQILANPFYQSLSLELRRHAGVHGDGEAWPVCGGPSSGT